MGIGTVKRLAYVLACGWCVLGLAEGGSAQGGSERRVDAVVAAVNGEAITWSALRLEMALNNLSPDDLSARRRTLETLIDRRLYLQHARHFTLITDARVEENLERIAQTFPSREAFLEDLARRGMTLDDARQQMRESLMLLQLEVRTFRPQVVAVSPTDVEAYYVSHREEFIVPEQVRLAQLLVGTPLEASPEAVETARATAERLRSAIVSGAETFESLVTSAPPGVVVGVGATFRAVGDFPPEIRSALERLEVGALSEPIVTPRGVYVVRLLERRASAVQPLAEVQDSIRAKIEGERLRAVMEAWIREQRAHADIRILDPELVSSP